MNAAIIDQILETPRGTCVSVVVSLFTPANMRKQNINVVMRAVKRAKKDLEIYSENDEVKETLSTKLDDLVSQFSNDGKHLGLGLFVSENVTGIIEFPFHVNEITLVGDSFEVRDIQYLKEYLSPYYVLLVAKGGVRLFRGVIQSLEEIRNDYFPVAFRDEYEYQRSSIGTSYGYARKGFEKDKSIIGASRLASMVRETVRHLPSAIDDAKATIVIVGPSKLSHEAAGFLPAPLKQSGILELSYNGKHFDALALAVWKEIQKIRRNMRDQLIKQIDDLGFNHRVDGIRAVWEAARKGKGRLLLVERDFRRIAYLPEGTEQIRLRPPKGRYVRIEDAVDDVIEKVKRRHGEVVFVEPSQLAHHEGIVLALRYQ